MQNDFKERTKQSIAEGDESRMLMNSVVENLNHRSTPFMDAIVGMSPLPRAGFGW
jgi:hypothetical protein